MSKTIEERANRCAWNLRVIGHDCEAVVKDAYTIGATEQRKIDIAKSTNEFSRFLDSLVVLFPKLKETIELQRIAWISSFNEKITED